MLIQGVRLRKSTQTHSAHVADAAEDPTGTAPSAICLFTSVGPDIKHARHLSPAITSIFEVCTLNNPAVTEHKTPCSWFGGEQNQLVTSIWLKSHSANSVHVIQLGRKDVTTATASRADTEVGVKYESDYVGLVFLSPYQCTNDLEGCFLLRFRVQKQLKKSCSVKAWCAQMVPGYGQPWWLGGGCNRWECLFTAGSRCWLWLRKKCLERSELCQTAHFPTHCETPV